VTARPDQQRQYLHIEQDNVKHRNPQRRRACRYFQTQTIVSLRYDDDNDATVQFDQLSAISYYLSAKDNQITG
jgi:hypothetical protein